MEQSSTDYCTAVSPCKLAYRLYSVFDHFDIVEEFRKASDKRCKHFQTEEDGVRHVVPRKTGTKAAFKRFWKRVFIPYYAVLLQCVGLPCQVVRFVTIPAHLWKVYQSVLLRYPFDAFCTQLLGATCCIPMGHSMGLHSGAHRGTVRFDLACFGPHQEVVRRGTIPRPVWYGYCLRERLNTL